MFAGAAFLSSFVMSGKGLYPLMMPSGWPTGRLAEERPNVDIHRYIRKTRTPLMSLSHSVRDREISGRSFRILHIHLLFCQMDGWVWHTGGYTNIRFLFTHVSHNTYHIHLPTYLPTYLTLTHDIGIIGSDGTDGRSIYSPKIRTGYIINKKGKSSKTLNQRLDLAMPRKLKRVGYT